MSKHTTIFYQGQRYVLDEAKEVEADEVTTEVAESADSVEATNDGESIEELISQAIAILEKIKSKQAGE